MEALGLATIVILAWNMAPSKSLITVDFRQGIGCGTKFEIKTAKAGTSALQACSLAMKFNPFPAGLLKSDYDCEFSNFTVNHFNLTYKRK